MLEFFNCFTFDEDDCTEKKQSEQGIVRKEYLNGEVYEGPVVHGLRHGEGAITIFKDGSKFSGRYVHFVKCFLILFNFSLTQFDIVALIHYYIVSISATTLTNPNSVHS